MQAEIEYTFQEIGLEITELYETTDSLGRLKWMLIDTEKYQFDTHGMTPDLNDENILYRDNWILYDKVNKKTTKGILKELIKKILAERIITG